MAAGEAPVERTAADGTGAITIAGRRRSRGRWIALGATALAILVSATLTVVLTRHHGPVASPPGPCSCSGISSCFDVPDSCNGGSRGPGGSITVAVGKADSWNIARGGTATAQQEAPLLPGVFTFLPSGKIKWNGDLLAAEPRVTSQAPFRVVYRIRPHAVWNDGTGRTYPLSAQDFVYTWRLFNGQDRSDPGIEGYDEVESVVGTDQDTTVTVTFREPYGDWRGLFANLEPYWFAAAATGADPVDAAGMTDAQLEAAYKALADVPRYSAGPYMVKSVASNGSIVEVPNPAWYGRDMPTLTAITFRPADDNELITLLQNEEIDAFNARPHLDLVQALSNMPGVNYQVGLSFSGEQLQFNTADTFLRDAKLREAIMDVVDVQEIIDRTVKPFYPGAQPRYSHNLFVGAAGYQDITRQADPVEGTGDLDKASNLLTAAGYTGVGSTNALTTPDGRHVTVTLVHTNTLVRDATARMIAGYLGKLGITVTDRVTGDLASTLSRRDFDIAEFGLANGPLLSTNASFWSTGGANNFTGWSDPTSDALLTRMTHTLDNAQQAALLNQQDRILTAAHVDLPLYQQPDVFAVRARYVNLRLNEAGSYFTYNTQEWGLLSVPQ